MNRKKVRNILRGLIRKIETHNNKCDDTIPFRVTKAWLFGSASKDKPEPNDVDVVIEMKRNPIMQEFYWRSDMRCGDPDGVVLGHLCGKTKGLSIGYKFDSKKYKIHPDGEYIDLTDELELVYLNSYSRSQNYHQIDDVLKRALTKKYVDRKNLKHKD